MENKNLQVENGNYTRIVNPLLEKLIQIPFKGCELAVALFILRKTYGYQKCEDSISLSQFQDGLQRSRQTIVTALKNLQLVNIVRLVKQGDSKKNANIWKINKYFESWKLVNTVRLVKRNNGTGLTKRSQLVKTVRHTKERTKENKERSKFFNDTEFTKLWEDYIKMRKTIKKPITEKGQELALKKLEKESIEIAKKMLEQSIFNSWQGLFQVKELPSIEQEAKELIGKYGLEQGAGKFALKYGDEVFNKYLTTLFKGII